MYDESVVKDHDYRRQNELRKSIAFPAAMLSSFETMVEDGGSIEKRITNTVDRRKDQIMKKFKPRPSQVAIQDNPFNNNVLDSI